MQTILIRPRIPLWLHLLTFLFAVGGIWLARGASDLVQEVVGWVITLLFGGGWLVVEIMIMLRPRTLALEPDGIRVFIEGVSPLIPWDDVEGLGVVNTGYNTFFGIRLATYERYLASASEDLKGLVAGGTEIANRMLSAKAERLANQMLRTRNAFGYDLIFPELMMDRPAKQVAELVQVYGTSVSQERGYQG
ncbi:MAG: STM3941 family protein [Bacillota bacterium]